MLWGDIIDLGMKKCRTPIYYPNIDLPEQVDSVLWGVGPGIGSDEIETICIIAAPSRSHFASIVYGRVGHALYLTVGEPMNIGTSTTMLVVEIAAKQ